jgi:hypothetical protein
MAIEAGMLIEISLVVSFDSVQVYNVWAYEVGTTIAELPADEVAAGWWNTVKGVYRATVRSSSGFFFKSVVVREMNNTTGALAEWTIPTSEQLGTREGVSTSEFMPQFNAAGARLTVGSRLTRPGQKRISGLLEVDNVSGRLEAGYITIMNALFDAMTTDITLSTPAVGMVLWPSVFSKDVTGAVVAHQPVIGYVVNPNVTSQVSRKLGRGI